MHRLAFVFWLLFTAGVAAAQDADGIASPRTLDQALSMVSWDVKQNGPLLVVNPQGTHALPASEPRTLPVPGGDGSLRTLAGHFSRQIVTVRSISVLAPLTMAVLNARPGMPDPYSGLLRGQKVRLLMGSLTPSQWQALGSPQGLGVGDLSRAQQPLFLSLLPDPFSLDSCKMSGVGKIHQPDKGFTLSPDERADVRLRVNRVAEIGLPLGNGGTGYFPDLQYAGLPDGTQFFTLAHPNAQSDPTAFGVALRSDVPNRLKPGSIAFDAAALRAPVQLAGAKSVRVLVGRVAGVTRRELYVDGRIAELPVWTRGAAASAGDILQSICLAVTGTLRKVGAVYVLTSDLQGLGTKYARLVDWAMDAQAMRQAALEDADKAAAPLQPQKYIGFAPNDTFTFSATTLDKLAANGRDPGFANQYSIPLESLQPEQQAAIRVFLSSQQKPLSGNRLKIQLTNTYSYLVPNVGVVKEEEFSSNVRVPAAALTPAALPNVKANLPPGLAARALYISPTKAKDVATFAIKARQKGLSQLWIEVPEGAAGQKLIKEAVNTGKESGLAVVAVLRLMQLTDEQTPPGAPLADLRDKNLLDETGSAHAARMLASRGAHTYNHRLSRFARTGDWLSPDSAGAQARLERRIRDVAVPGLSGMAFLDIAPPGYQDRGERADPLSTTSSYDFGYTPSMRLAFLRKTGYDPIDLVDRQFFVPDADLSLPFFPSQAASFRLNPENGQLEAQGARSALQDWNAYRYKTAARLLTHLHHFVRENYPGLSLLLRQSPHIDGWWGGWEIPDQLPVTVSVMAEDTASKARQLSGRPLLLNILYAGSPAPETAPTSARHFAQWVEQRLERRKGGWDGVVLDLSALPARQALEVMDGLADRAERSPPPLKPSIEPVVELP